MIKIGACPKCRAIVNFLYYKSERRGLFWAGSDENKYEYEERDRQIEFSCPACGQVIAKTHTEAVKMLNTTWSTVFVFTSSSGNTRCGACMKEVNRVYTIAGSEAEAREKLIGNEGLCLKCFLYDLDIREKRVNDIEQTASNT